MGESRLPAEDGESKEKNLQTETHLKPQMDAGERRWELSENQQEQTQKATHR